MSPFHLSDDTLADGKEKVGARVNPGEPASLPLWGHLPPTLGTWGGRQVALSGSLVSVEPASMRFCTDTKFPPPEA